MSNKNLLRFRRWIIEPAMPSMVFPVIAEAIQKLK